MIRPNVNELEIVSETRINGIKLILNCKTCGRKWSIWFKEEADLLNNLPKDWHICMTCKNKFSDKELKENEYVGAVK